MKFLFCIFLILLVIFITGCEHSDDDISLESLENTQWFLEEVINNETGKITSFPDEIEKFNIIFKQNGAIQLPKNCNFSQGTFQVTGNDSLVITSIGPGTKKYCLPDLFMEWETLFIQHLVEARTYAIDGHKLTLFCDSEYDLVFDYLDKYNKGNLLVCTNSNLMNCVWEIDFSVNNKSYSINAGSTYPDHTCQCSDTNNTGLLLELEEGTYEYEANELNCVAENKTNSWSGQVTVSTDSCTLILLDIFQ